MKLSKEFIAMFREEAKKAQWEINCWNGKSIDDLVVDYLERKELKPEDFTDCVVLTVEEAKGLLEIARDYRMYLFEHCRIPLSLSSNEAFTALRERIEQAEKKK